MSRIKETLDHPFFGDATDAAKQLHRYESLRDLPPEVDEGLPECPYCNGTRFVSPYGSESALLRCVECGEEVHESELLR